MKLDLPNDTGGIFSTFLAVQAYCYVNMVRNFHHDVTKSRHSRKDHHGRLSTAICAQPWGDRRVAPHQSLAYREDNRLHFTALYCTELYCTALHCTSLHCTVLHCTVLFFTALYCTALYYTALHCTALQDIVPQPRMSRGVFYDPEGTPALRTTLLHPYYVLYTALH